MVSFPPVSPPRPYTLPSPHPYAAPHAQPISFFSILSPAQYWVSSTNHLAPRFAISSIPPLPLNSYVQIFSSTPVHTHPQLLFLPQCQGPSFTPIQNNRQNYSSIYLIFKFGNHSELATCLYEVFCLQCPILSPPKTFAFPTESSCIVDSHNIHGIPQLTLHWSLIYYQDKQSVNFVYQSAAIRFCNTMLHARHAPVSKASPHTSQRTLPQPTIASMTAQV